ncbi:MAG TPA: endonuclease/exonuclease/phosphatase family protein, partial [Thermoanaerobaculia bacterium]|nr:endonuclease/exonuclease/phosphatase family protein [Thermoanaerobaculia bacterium]
MAETFRLATFNVENLFARYRFRQNQEAYADEGFTINQLAFDIYNETEKRITAQAVQEVDADIICLQEVESLPLLDRFNSSHLGSEPAKRYNHRLVIDCFDPRQIDVAILSRFPIVGVRTHRHERNAANTAPLFSRDCLEADVLIEGKVLTLYVNHLKSMMDGRAETRARRKEQADRVAEIVDKRWRPSYDGNFVVLGDLNDYMDAQTALKRLVGHAALENILDRAPEAERWTHYYAGGNEYRQLDYILVSKSFDARAGSPVPQVMRKGLPWRAEKYSGPRFEGVGHDNPKASDHSP